MTEKLYYIDSYTKSFTAEVIKIEKSAEGYEVVLDRTAFFPEEGGQSADTGVIGSARVYDVYEKQGVIYHKTLTPPEKGSVDCLIDFDKRFEKMQIRSCNLD